MAELVNLWQYEDQARAKVGAARLAPVTGSDRTVTDRIILMPRVNIPARDLDLTTSLFGDNHFTPIIVGLVLSVVLALIADLIILGIQRGSLPWARRGRTA